VQKVLIILGVIIILIAMLWPLLDYLIFKFNYEPFGYKKLLDLIEDAEFVLIGESTHGTQEFYQIRAELTKKLIEEKSFDAIAIEGDWPDTYNINNYVKDNSNAIMKSSLESLSGFQRFPTWMWRNKVVLDFIYWLRNYNNNLSDNEKIGFYGLDLYSVNKSIDLVISYLDKIDKSAANKARERYGCFNKLKEELSKYGYATFLE